MPIGLEIWLGLTAVVAVMWVVTIFLFRPHGRLTAREGEIQLYLKNSKVSRIIDTGDGLLIKLDRETKIERIKA